VGLFHDQQKLFYDVASRAAKKARERFIAKVANVHV
jgi:hypothetical protein